MLVRSGRPTSRIATFEVLATNAQGTDTASFEQWSAEGGLWQHERAAARVRRLLDEYEPPAMDAAKREALDDFVARRTREIEGDG